MESASPAIRSDDLVVMVSTINPVGVAMGDFSKWVVGVDVNIKPSNLFDDHILRALLGIYFNCHASFVLLVLRQQVLNRYSLGGIFLHQPIGALRWKSDVKCVAFLFSRECFFNASHHVSMPVQVDHRVFGRTSFQLIATFICDSIDPLLPELGAVLSDQKLSVRVVL